MLQSSPRENAMIGLIAALVLFAQATPAAEGPTVADPPKAEASAKPDTKAGEKAGEDKVVCREQVVVGSHFRQKVCRSQRSEATRRQEDQETFRHAQQQGQIVPH